MTHPEYGVLGPTDGMKVGRGPRKRTENERKGETSTRSDDVEILKRGTLCPRRRRTGKSYIPRVSNSRVTLKTSLSVPHYCSCLVSVYVSNLLGYLWDPVSKPETQESRGVVLTGL